MKRRKYIMNWKKSLESVKKLNRQNLNKEVLPMEFAGSPDWTSFFMRSLLGDY